MSSIKAPCAGVKISLCICPFKETEGKHEGLWWPRGDGGAQPVGAGPLAIKQGEMGGV